MFPRGVWIDFGVATGPSAPECFSERADPRGDGRRVRDGLEVATGGPDCSNFGDVQFDFSEDQRMFRDNLRSFLEKECTPELIRKLWDTDTGRSKELWAKLGELGILGMLVPEEHGGLGMDEIDLVLLLEETGRVALAEPIVETAAVAAPLLAELGGDTAAEWLPKIAAGEAVVTLGHPLSPVIADAHVAELLLVERDGALHAVPSSAADLTAQACSDASRRLFTIEFAASDATKVADGERAATLVRSALDRGALSVAAQMVGMSHRMVEIAVEYAKQREQFGKPIGSFQAIKHMLATVQVKTEFARPLVYRAAHSIARDTSNRSVDVSQANAAASEAASLAAKTALQVHGGIGYTWEVDLHLWMKRAWALESAWGSRRFHRRRIAEAVLDSDTPPPSFGFSARV